MKRWLVPLVSAVLAVGCNVNPAGPTVTDPSPSPSSGTYRGTITVERIELACNPNGFFYRCTGWVRLHFDPAIREGYPLIVDVDGSSLNNGFYDRGPFVLTGSSSGYWSAFTVGIGGDISYCPFSRQVHVNVADYNTGRALTNGIPITWERGGSCG
jgi:hypothetical protein